MATYRITKNHWADEDHGKIIEWDGVTVDEDEEVDADLDLSLYSSFIHKDHLELVEGEPVNASKAQLITKTVEVERVVIELSKVEAKPLRDLLLDAEDYDDGLDELFDALDEVVGDE